MQTAWRLSSGRARSAACVSRTRRSTGTESRVGTVARAFLSHRTVCGRRCLSTHDPHRACSPARRVTAFGTVVYPDRTTMTGEHSRPRRPTSALLSSSSRAEQSCVSRRTSTSRAKTKQGGIELHGDTGSVYLSDWQQVFDATVELARFGEPYEAVAGGERLSGNRLGAGARRPGGCGSSRRPPPSDWRARRPHRRDPRRDDRIRYREPSRRDHVVVRATATRLERHSPDLGSKHGNARLRTQQGLRADDSALGVDGDPRSVVLAGRAERPLGRVLPVGVVHRQALRPRREGRLEPPSAARWSPRRRSARSARRRRCSRRSPRACSTPSAPRCRPRPRPRTTRADRWAGDRGDDRLPAGGRRRLPPPPDAAASPPPLDPRGHVTGLPLTVHPVAWSAATSATTVHRSCITALLVESEALLSRRVPPRTHLNCADLQAVSRARARRPRGCHGTGAVTARRDTAAGGPTPVWSGGARERRSRPMRYRLLLRDVVRRARLVEEVADRPYLTACRIAFTSPRCCRTT